LDLENKTLRWLKLLNAKALAIDTGVWIEALIQNAPYYKLANFLIKKVLKGEIQALITPLTATEILYITHRIYRETYKDEKIARNKALEYFDTIYHNENVLVRINKEIIVNAAEIKIKYSLSMSDSYILSLAKTHKIPVVFRHIEKEMENKLDELQKEFKIIFLEQIQ